MSSRRLATGTRGWQKRGMSRLVSTVSLALALTAQLTTLVHMGAIEHETCAEHGELVEVGFAGTDVPAGPGPDGQEEDEHDHCLLAHTPTVSETGPVLARVIFVASAERDIAAPRERVVAATVLRSAPKTSPPLV
jgi:hypothetical protein